MIADCGGLFGLFLGFSFTTIVRLIRSLIDDKIQNTEKDKNNPKITKIQPIGKSSWIMDIDNQKDLKNLLHWQLEARERGSRKNSCGFNKKY